MNATSLLVVVAIGESTLMRSKISRLVAFGTPHRWWVIVLSAFMLLTGVLVAKSIISDRAATIQSVQDRTSSIARLTMAHGEAAIGDANAIISAVEQQVVNWDLQDLEQGGRIRGHLLDHLIGSPYISSAWILDGQGVNRLDTGEFPAKPFTVDHRPYFQKHLAGMPNSVISVDPDPAGGAGEEMFTFSRAQRDKDGELRSVVVVEFDDELFDPLFSEALAWPNARAGLYSLSGDVLAHLRSSSRSSPRFRAELETQIRSRPFGSAILDEDGVARLSSWQRSSLYPDLYARSSQTISSSLNDWRQRSILIAAIAGAAVLLLAVISVMNARAIHTRQAMLAKEIALREVHHRVKNALQIVSSMTSLRMRQARHPEVRAELATISAQISAVGNVQELLQSTSDLDEVQACVLLERLVDHLKSSFSGEIRFVAGENRAVDADTATALAIITNELVTNAIKHARRTVEVRCGATASTFTVDVTDDGAGLPGGFDLRSQLRFGLRTASQMAENVGGRLSFDRAHGAGAIFRLEVPSGKSGWLRPSRVRKLPMCTESAML